jgi:hypothetical protein
MDYKHRDASWCTSVAMWKGRVIARVHVYRGKYNPRGVVAGNSCVNVGTRDKNSARCMEGMGTDELMSTLKAAGLNIDRIVHDADASQFKIVLKHFPKCVEALDQNHVRNSFIKRVCKVLSRGDPDKKGKPAETNDIQTRVVRERVGRNVFWAFKRGNEAALNHGREEGVKVLIESLTSVSFHIADEHSKCTDDSPCRKAIAENTEYGSAPLMNWQAKAVQNLIEIALIKKAICLVALPGENTCLNESIHHVMAIYARKKMVITHCYSARVDCAILNNLKGVHMWIQEIRRRLELQNLAEVSVIGQRRRRTAEKDRFRRQDQEYKDKKAAAKVSKADKKNQELKLIVAEVAKGRSLYMGKRIPSQRLLQAFFETKLRIIKDKTVKYYGPDVGYCEAHEYLFLVEHSCNKCKIPSRSKAKGRPRKRKLKTDKESEPTTEIQVREPASNLRRSKRRRKLSMRAIESIDC